MIKKFDRAKARQKRHLRIRKTISGTPETPRLSVFKSNQHITAQIIDDVNGVTLASAGTDRKDVKATGNVEGAKLIGEMIAKEANKKGITNVVFDRGGFIYHGKVKALAEAARENGLKF